MRRFTRLTNGFSKKVENLVAAVSLHFMYYNFARPHKSLSNPYPRTPAMATDVTTHLRTLKDIAALLASDRPTTPARATGRDRAPTRARRHLSRVRPPQRVRPEYLYPPARSRRRGW
jgi:hypothetical protein